MKKQFSYLYVNAGAKIKKCALSNSQEKGMVTAETAFSLLALSIVFVLMFSLIGATSLYLHAQDLSRAAARSLSLGTDVDEVRRSLSQAAPYASLLLENHEETITVTVTLDPPPPVNALGLDISATTCTPREPGVHP